MIDDGYTIVAPGVSQATGGVSAVVALPNNSAGALPRFVRVATTAAAYVRLGTAGATAVAGDVLVQPGDALLLARSGLTHIAAIQVTAAGVMQVSPIEGG